MGTGKDPRVRQAFELARAGDKDRARELLIQLLTQDRGNFDAWVVMAQVSENRQEAIASIRQALRLRPGDEKASRYLQYLLADEQADGAPAGVSPWLWSGLAAAVMFLLVAIFFVFIPNLGSPDEAGQSETASGEQPVSVQASDCSILISQALEISDQGCQTIGPNQVCYGHNTVEVQLVPGSAARFDQPGSTIPIDILERFIAFPLDVQKNDWGVGVFRLEANLPGTLPGQLVTMLVFGNTSLQNAGGDMQAFYFTSGLGGIKCDEVPFDGILVRMAEGAGLAFKANGADVTLSGSSLLQAAAHDSMTVAMLSGTGRVNALGREQDLDAGETVTVPLGGADGMQANEPPSAPTPMEEILTDLGCALTGQGCPEEGEDVAQAATNTPVPIDPARPTNTPVPVAPGQPTNTPVPLSTNTPAPLSTNTPTPAIKATSTASGSAVTNTPKPDVATSTTIPLAATKTKTPVPTNTATLTRTPVPTATTPPTATTIPPTATTPPPPPTATTDVCASISVSWGGINTTNNKAMLNVASVTPTTLETVQVSNWPSGNGKLQNINDTYEVNASSPPALVTLSMSINGSTVLAFKFQSDVAKTGYSFTLTFSGGCSKGITQ